MFLPSNIDSLNAILNNPSIFLILTLLSIWALVWKGFALWKAAKFGQRNWFIALLVINTFGILEIIYLFYLGQPKTEKKSQNIDKSV